MKNIFQNLQILYMNLDQSEFQLAKCSKDGKLYAYNIDEHQDKDQDYSSIKCFPVNGTIEPDSDEVIIYRKDLMKI